MVVLRVFLNMQSIEKLKFDMRLGGQRSQAHYVQSVLGDPIDASLPLETACAVQSLEDSIGEGPRSWAGS